MNPTVVIESPCQACGACCSYSSNWPRFTTEEDAALDLIPEKFVNERLSGMRCEGDRCSALSGKVGETTSCLIYAMAASAQDGVSPLRMMRCAGLTMRKALR